MTIWGRRGFLIATLALIGVFDATGLCLAQGLTIDQLAPGAPLVGNEKMSMFQVKNPAVSTTPNAINIYILNQMGLGVPVALQNAANAASGVPVVNATVPTVGDCLEWGPGIEDAGARCGSVAPLSGITGLGIGVATALANTAGAAGGFATYNQALQIASLGAGVPATLENSAGAAGGFATYNQLGSGAFASVYSLPTATNAVLGGVMPDGTTITNVSGAISVTYGTAANTAAQGNDARILGAFQIASLGANVGTALGDALNAANGVAGVYGTVPTVGHCLEWGPGIEDAGAACGSGGGGSGTVSSGNANSIAYYPTTDTSVAGITPANNGVLVTSGAGVPSIASTLPSAVQGNITSVGTLSSGAVPTTLITGLGTGVATALGNNVGAVGAFVVNGGALGTPGSGVATNLTGTASGLTAGTVTTNANLTGDVTSSGNATTLATVNAGSGSVGSSTAIPVLTTNGKGLVTAQSTAAVVAPAGTLSGATLASNVVSSSLTSVGTLSAGTVPTSLLSGTLAAAQEPAHSGDATNAAGSLAMTLATVNSGPGAVGSSTAIPVLTTNGKGLVTAQTTAAVVAPAGTLSGTTLASNVVSSSLTGVGTLSSGAIPTTLMTGVLAAAQEPAHTGDVTNSAGSLALTLTTVNSTPGSVGSSTAIPILTVNGKGLVTSQSTAAIVAPAGTLTGTTLASGVTASSLTSVGTLATLGVAGALTATGIPAADNNSRLRFEESGGENLFSISPPLLPGIFGDYTNPNTNNKHFIGGALSALGYAGQITNVVSGGGLCRLSVAVTSFMTVGDSVTITGIPGATGTACNGTTTIAAINPGVSVDLAGTTFAGTYSAPTPTAAGSFLIGQAYMIASVGTTNFVALGAASNTVGVWFDANAAGSGTGTALAASAQAKIVDNSATSNNDLLALSSYSPPAGTDSSTVYLTHSGGGNTMSVYNLCGSTPPGFTAYCEWGRGIEVWVDGSKSAIVAQALNGATIQSYISPGSTGGAGLEVLPGGAGLPGSLRGIDVFNYVGSTLTEMAYTTIAGNSYQAGNLIAMGSASIGTSSAAGIFNVGAGNSYFNGLINETLPGTTSINAFSAYEALLASGPSSYVIMSIGIDSSSHDSANFAFGYAGGSGSTANYSSMNVSGAGGVLAFGTGDVSIDSTSDAGVAFYVNGAGKIGTTLSVAGGVIGSSVLSVGAGSIGLAGAVTDNMIAAGTTTAIGVYDASLSPGSALEYQVGFDLGAAHDWGFLAFVYAGSGSTANALVFGLSSTVGIYEFGTGDVTIGSSTDFGVPLYVNGGVTASGKLSVGSHILAASTTPTISACGTGSPSVVGSDNFGTITAGGGTLTSCVINFGTAWTTAPACSVGFGTAALAVTVATSTTQLTVGATSLSGYKIFYTCGSVSMREPANDNNLFEEMAA